MNNDSILYGVVKVVAGHLNLNRKEVVRNDSLIDDLGASSSDMVAIITDIENVFGMLILEKYARDFHTVGDIADYISAHKK